MHANDETKAAWKSSLNMKSFFSWARTRYGCEFFAHYEQLSSDLGIRFLKGAPYRIPFHSVPDTNLHIRCIASSKKSVDRFTAGAVPERLHAVAMLSAKDDVRHGPDTGEDF